MLMAATVERQRWCVTSQKTGASPATKTSTVQVEWEAHPSPYGAPFYFNRATGESRWVLPTGPFDAVILPATVASSREPSHAAAATLELKQLGTHTTSGATVGQQTPGVAPDAANARAADLASVPCDDSSSSSESSDDAGVKKVTSALRQARANLLAFRELLSEHRVGPFERYERWIPRLTADPRFIALPAAYRRQLFQQEIKRLGDMQHKEGVKRNAHPCDCTALQALVTTAAERGLLQKAVSVQAAMSAIANSELGKDERWCSARVSEKERLVTKAWKVERHRELEAIAERRSVFRTMISEKILDPDAPCAEPPPFAEARKLLRADPRWMALDSVTERQSVYAEEAKKSTKQWLLLRKRQLAEEDKLQEQRKRSCQAQDEEEFREILQDHVKNPLLLSWDEVRILLDGLDTPAGLNEASRERVFNSMRDVVAQQRLAALADAFRGLPANETHLEHSFEQAFAAAMVAFGGESQLCGIPAADIRRTWEIWRRMRIEQAVQSFKSWLLQSGHLAGLASTPGASALDRLCARIQDNPHYQSLNAVPQKRHAVLELCLSETTDRRLPARCEEGNNYSFDFG